MNLTIDIENEILIASVSGRLDAFGAGNFQAEIQEKITGMEPACVLLDMGGVEYISSAGIRALLVIFKQLGNRPDSVVLCGLGAYCADVIKMTGFQDVFPQFADKASALAFCRDNLHQESGPAVSEENETAELSCGTAVIIPVGRGPGVVDIIGDVKDVLYARITEQDICSKKFFETEYSIGLGGLGDKIQDYFKAIDPVKR